MKSRPKGFTLIELLVVVAIIGILAAIAIPNLLTAIQRSKQKRTMADMRTIAVAWEARATDLNRYNSMGAITAIARCSNLINPGALSSAVTPTYIHLLPEHDGWGNVLKLYADQAWNTPEAASNYIIWSAAKNGNSNGSSGWDATAGSPGGATTNFNDDILFSNGTFIQYPEGVQSQ